MLRLGLMPFNDSMERSLERYERYSYAERQLVATDSESQVSQVSHAPYSRIPRSTSVFDICIIQSSQWPSLESAWNVPKHFESFRVLSVIHQMTIGF